MKESIIVRCPECGQWVEIPYSGAGTRALESFGRAYEVGENFAKGMGLSSKMQKALGTFTSFAGGATGVTYAKAAFEGAFGDAYNGSCPECGHEFSYDNDSFDETEEYNDFLEELEQEKRENSLSYILKSRFNDDDIIPENVEIIDKYIKDLENAVKSEEDAALRSDLYDILSLMYWWKEEDETALEYSDKACAEPIERNELSPLLRAYYISELDYIEDKQVKNHYENLSDIIKFKFMDDGYLLTKEAYRKAFERSKQIYVDGFLSIPPSERRFIVLSDKFDTFSDNFYVLPFGNLPKGLLIDGDPEENELYIRHPYKANKYILAKNYAISIFRDKAYEFKDIMVKLGAKEFFFTDTSESTNSIEGSKHFEAGANVSIAGKGGGGINGQYDTMAREQRKALNQIKEHTKYNLTEIYPYVPEDTVWYPHEEKWQKEVEDRLDGRTSVGDYVITLNESVSVSQKKQLKINADLKLLAGEGNANFGYEGNIAKDLEVLHTWKCHVEFYPISMYSKDGFRKTEKLKSFADDQISAEEQKYLDAIKVCVADGEFGGSERRFLNRVRIKLGISEERAAELETSLQKPQLTEEEQEYFETYQEALEDGVISEKERCMLDTIMKMNNISEERAKEIEMLNK